MSLKLLQYPNKRHRPISEICQRRLDHPSSYEPPHQCSMENCETCIGLSQGRAFINACYIAQHKENTDEAIHGKSEYSNSIAHYDKKKKFFSVLIGEGNAFLEHLIQHKLFSMLFFHRRADNKRGTPAVAALKWALMEETRLYAERRFNINYRTDSRPLRETIHRLIGMYSVLS